MHANDLLIVWPHAAFRRPPDLGRADVRAAFHVGVEHSTAGFPRPLEGLDLSDPAVRHAYTAGVQDPLGPPTYLADLTGALGNLVLGRTGPVSLREDLPLVLAGLAVAYLSGTLDVRIRRRSARRLGLTKLTVPVPASALGPALQTAIVIAVRIRAGRRQREPVRKSPATALAAQIVRATMSRRSWRAARPTG